jgi:hypothetical protein
VPHRAIAVRERVPDRGMQVLEQKLSILSQGPSRTRRNPALDVLTGRVPDERLQSLQASLFSVRAAAVPGSRGAPASTAPSAMVLPVAAIRMAAVARASHPAASPWLQASSPNQPRIRLISPPPSRWSRVPWVGGFLAWVMGESRPYTYSERTHRAHLAS